jgi:hypothetical protein
MMAKYFDPNIEANKPTNEKTLKEKVNTIKNVTNRAFNIYPTFKVTYQNTIEL